jgi:SAM-dependent methyltransferase
MLSSILKRILPAPKKTDVGQASEYEIDLSYFFATGNIVKNPLEISAERIFPEVFVTDRRETLIGINREKKELIKIELCKNPRKSVDIVGEYKMLRRLNERGAVSSPIALDLGTINISDLKKVVKDEYLVIAENTQQFNYIVQEFIETKGKMQIADLIFAMLEQKSLGIYHGDIKPANIRFDAVRGVCILVDYDQAEELPQAVAKMNTRDFLAWCDTHEKEKYKGTFDTWRRHFSGLNYLQHISPMLRDGAFNLAFTTPYQRQATTNTDNGIYHTINGPVVYADGVRDIQDRAVLLDKIEFVKGEKVLDVGCNAGLLCHYLFARDCNPTGIDMDASIVVSAKVIANILGIDANFIALDLDNADVPGKFDTVCLFSVIHHTQHINENGRKIAERCNRILIECRLAEHGRKPVKNRFGKVKWIDTSVWDYPNEEMLAKGLTRLFPGFTVKRKVGNADKNRMLYEMIKQ